MGKDLYKSSGVDIDKGDALVEWLKSSSDNPPSITKVGQVAAGIGGFAGVFTPNFKKMEEPQLVAGSDGVGTKLLLAIEERQLGGVGIDLVAMCANDLYCIGARPMFFVDYYATGKLDDEQFRQVLTGIKKGLVQAQCSLLGGETAELPGLYADGHLDLAGFIVGVVDRKKQIGPHLIKPGDKLLAIPSTGFHSNGYSLVRKWLERSSRSSELIQHLLAPTAIYGWIPDWLEKQNEFQAVIHGLANITGGGISGNLVRILPDNLEAIINFDSLPTPKWMKDFIMDSGSKPREVEEVFNLGVGMIAVVDSELANRVIDDTSAMTGIQLTVIGEVKESQSTDQTRRVIFIGS